MIICCSHYHCKFPHVVTVLWQGSDDVVTILSPTSGTSGRLQNRVSVPPWFLHGDTVLDVTYLFHFIKQNELSMKKEANYNKGQKLLIQIEFV